MGEHRTERDSLGDVAVPANAYWGATTQRAVDAFPISGWRHLDVFIDAFVMLKKAAALGNRDLGALDAEMAETIVGACDDILDGKLRDQFPVDVFQMGAGTSIHMNVNEVLANRANERLGHALGSGGPVSANDHVNFGQSTNDCFPTATRLAVLLALRDQLSEPLGDLENALSAKATDFDGVLKSGRTHLQDAAPIRLGQEFAAWSLCVGKCHRALATSQCDVRELGIGGSAVGTGLNTAPGYREAILGHLREVSAMPELTLSTDMREAMQSQRPVGVLVSELRSLAIELSRISNDLRLLSSGPTTGLGEINLPAIAPGSSIMPGKVNPSIPEMVNMVCFQVVGCATAVDWAIAAGQLELNVMMPVIAHNALMSIRILGAATCQLTDRCVIGITFNVERCRDYAEQTLGLATALNTRVGYQAASAVASQAVAEGRSLIDIVRERGLLDEAEIARVMDAKSMTEPGIPGG